MAVPIASGEAPIIEIDMEGTKAVIVEQAETIVKELHDHWHKAVIQIEAMHDQLAQIVMQQKDQLETRLVVMDKKLRETADSMANASADMSEEIEAEEKQAEIMNELIAAVAKINEHVLEIDDVIDEAGLRKGA
jgi:chromosome segregation ATPase